MHFATVHPSTAYLVLRHSEAKAGSDVWVTDRECGRGEDERKGISTVIIMAK